MTAVDLDQQILNLELNEDAFVDGDDSVGMRKLAQFTLIREEDNPPEWDREGQQVVFWYKPLGWYKGGVMTPAPAGLDLNRIYCPLKTNKSGQINRASKLGIVMQAFQSVLGVVRVSEIVGKVLWLEDTVIEFGKDKTGKTLSSKVSLPIGIPTAEEVKAVQFMIDGTDARPVEDRYVGAEDPTAGHVPVEYDETEFAALLELYDGKNNGQVGTAVFATNLREALKMAVLRDEQSHITEQLIETGRLTYSGGVYRALPF